MVALGVLILATIGLRLANPQILRSFLDTATAGGSLPEFLFDAILFFVIAVASQGLAVASTSRATRSPSTRRSTRSTRRGS